MGQMAFLVLLFLRDNIYSKQPKLSSFQLSKTTFQKTKYLFSWADCKHAILLLNCMKLLKNIPF